MIEGGKENVSVKTAVHFSNHLRAPLHELFQKPAGHPRRVSRKRARQRR